MEMMRSREIRLRQRPSGLPTPADFDLVETAVPEPGPGEVLVRNLYMSVDPYMRGRMIERKSYVPPFQLGQPLEGGAVGRVVAAKAEGFAPGDFVLHQQGWRDYALVAAKGAGLAKVDPGLAPLPAFLGVLGMPGMTAYVGLLRIAALKENETVFVSAAAGAVGQIACQIAKIKNCRVIGSAGSEEKIRWLKEEAGIDAAFNYKTAGDLAATLRGLCPDGIDVYFENVGGAHFAAALDTLNNFGRIALCGLIETYNAPEPPPMPGNLMLAIMKRLTLRGFIVSDHGDMRADFFRDMAQWIAAGRIKWRETVVEGLENAPKAFIGLFKGENIGKMVVKIADESETRAAA